MKSSNSRIRLTKQHWLNVIIISVSAMFLLSVLVGRMLDHKGAVDEDKSKDFKIVQIDFSEIQFNLDNAIWFSSDTSFQHEHITRIVKRWKNLLLQHGRPSKDKLIAGRTILIYLENIPQPIVAKLNLTSDYMRISFTSANQEFYLDQSDFHYYYPHLTTLN
jgi:hypothetical protein